MRRAFQLIKTRLLSDKINISKIEDELGFSLPPVYKFFIENFETGENSFVNESFFNPKRNENYILNAPLYEPLKDNDKWFLSISYFDDLSKVAHDWKSYLRNEKEWTDFKFLRIADIGQGGGLYVSTREEDVDMIYQVVWDWEEPYFKVADNIFEMIKGFVLPDLKGSIADEYQTSQLYKNYGEDFWRVREENI
jgi:hypothetical protein